MNQPLIPSDYGETMIKLYRDRKQDVLTRDFAVQHIGLYAQALNRRGEYVAASAKSQKLRSALFDAAGETSTIVAAAAFCALSDMSAFDSRIDAGRYMSFEAVVNAHKAEYYEALKESSAGWNESQPRYFPFMLNSLSTLYECYNELDRRFGSVAAAKVSKKRRIEATVLNSFTPLGKSDICAMLPDVSPTTVEAVLGAMVRSGLIRRLGGGRGTKYIKA